MDRRNLLYSVTAAAITTAVTRPFAALAQTATGSSPEETEIVVGMLPPLPSDLVGREKEPPFPYVDTALVGSGVPSREEIESAYDILLGSPFGVKPIDVAQYFLEVGAGTYGEKLRPFAREWPVRANPVIYHFFSATQTAPEGDTTAWCAAFMNWCLLRSHATAANQIGKAPGSFSKGGKPFDPEAMKKYSTNNASSGSFRCWRPISDPQRGDIVVFANKGTESDTPSCRGQGHVAMFLSVPKDGWVRVLGGNQVFPGSGGAVTISDMRTGLGSRFLHYAKAR